MSAPGSRPHRRLTLGVTAFFVLAGVGPSLGCRNRKNLAEHVMDDPASELSSARCGGDGQIVRPLIIEWPATDRASLEGRLQRGLVVVRYQGCVVEVLRECAAPVADSGYEYLGITRKLDSIAIRSSDELYANMPLTAVKLEAKLAKAGELNVSMALVGNYEAKRARYDIGELEGRCSGATHVIAAAQVGAFEFFAGAGAEIGAAVEVESVAGAGGRSTASREVLNRDGDAQACTASRPGDLGPPPECGALLRLELSALDGIVPTCQPGSSWNGSACVADASFGDGQGRPTQDGGATGGHSGSGGGGNDKVKNKGTAEGQQLAWQLCELQMRCQAAESGVEPPEGETYQRQMTRCANVTRVFIDNDYGRPQARKCVAEAPSMSCAELQQCMSGPDLDQSDSDQSDSDW